MQRTSIKPHLYTLVKPRSGAQPLLRLRLSRSISPLPPVFGFFCFYFESASRSNLSPSPPPPNSAERYCLNTFMTSAAESILFSQFQETERTRTSHGQLKPWKHRRCSPALSTRDCISWYWNECVMCCFMYSILHAAWVPVYSSAAGVLSKVYFVTCFCDTYSKVNIWYKFARIALCWK